MAVSAAGLRKAPSMFQLTLGSACETGPARCGSAAPLRTVLLGGFDMAEGGDRAMLRALPATASGKREQDMRDVRPEVDPVEQAETQLAHDAVDLVLLDLSGPVGVMLSLVGRLRAAAGQDVVFIGIMPWQVDDASRVYLSAVVDEVIDAPLQPDGVPRAVAELLRVGSGSAGIVLCAPAVIGTTTRH